MLQNPTTFLYRLACSFATAEGAFAVGSLPNRDNNPGDLRIAPWILHPTILGGFWRPQSIAEGVAGLYHQLALDIARGQTLRQLVYSYAPASDGNNSANYLAETLRRMDMLPTDADTPLWSYLTPLEKII